MSTLVWIQTKDGKQISGISYSINAAALSTDPNALAATIAGGTAAGFYHLRTQSGWVNIPASQVAKIYNVQPGAPT